jgi:putative copper resistance protein D
MTPADAAAVVSRLLQCSAAAVVGGASLFFVYGVAADGRSWPMRLVGLAAGAGLIGTALWLMAQTAQIADAPSDAFDPAKVWSVAAGTGFGRVALMRLACFVLALTLTSFPRRRGRGVWLALAALGIAASASFAWTGHGTMNDGLDGVVHLTADVLHLLAASAWIGALTALAVVLALAWRDVTPGRDSLVGLDRFSRIGVAVVAVLAASGLVNSWYLVGPQGIGRLVSTAYGLLLMAKLSLFGVMLALAAANRYRHAPRLESALRSGEVGGGPFRPALVSVAVELVLALAVLVLVSWLGTLSPPIEA